MKRKAILFVNRKKSEALDLSKEISAVLEKKDWVVDSYNFDRKDAAVNPGEYDIGLSLGGDGTVLYTSRVLSPLGTPVLPVNLGTLGFISAVHPGQWEAVFSRWERGAAAVSMRLMLEIRVQRGGKETACLSCLNDAVISASGIPKLIRLQVEAETPEGKIDLGEFRADGLIAASPTGSTGYSVAAGGPIIDPEMDLIIINPICPFTLSARPLVLPADEKVQVLVEREQRSAVLLTVDGQITRELEPGDTVSICRAPYRAHLIASDRASFYQALRSKLAWSGGRDA